jgi:CRP-like cAMP-binding protein
VHKRLADQFPQGVFGAPFITAVAGLDRASKGCGMTAALETGLNGQNRLLAALEQADFALLSPHLNDARLEQGAVLQEVGDPIQVVHFPRSGMISLLAVMEGGHAVETATIGREGAVGVTAGLWGASRSTGRAVVQVEGVLSCISAARFRNAVSQSRALRDLMSRYNGAQGSLVCQVAGCNALHQAPARLCRCLLQTRDRSDSDTLWLTHESLCEMIGVQQTTATILARELQALGLISYGPGHIEILDRGGLERKACQCYQSARRMIEWVFSEGGA